MTKADLVERIVAAAQGSPRRTAGSWSTRSSMPSRTRLNREKASRSGDSGHSRCGAASRAPPAAGAGSRRAPRWVSCGWRGRSSDYPRLEQRLAAPGRNLEAESGKMLAEIEHRTTKVGRPQSTTPSASSRRSYHGPPSGRGCSSLPSRAFPCSTASAWLRMGCSKRCRTATAPKGRRAAARFP